MQRIVLFLLAFWCGAFAQNQPMNDSAAVQGTLAQKVDSAMATAGKDSVGIPAAKDTAAAVTAPAMATAVKDSAAGHVAKDTAAAVTAPTMDTLPTVAAPVVPAIDTVALAREKARRDSIRAAREEAATSMEWHTVSDSGTPPAVVGTKFPEPEGRVTSRPSERSAIPFPEVPEEQESRVLMWTGVGLSVVGLVAFFAFNGAGEKQTAAVDLNPVTDPTAGNPDATDEKTMTIRWSH